MMEKIKIKKYYWEHPFLDYEIQNFINHVENNLIQFTTNHTSPFIPNTNSFIASFGISQTTLHPS
jgi:hypothetical protein